MKTPSNEHPSSADCRFRENLLCALDLMELGVLMMRQNLKRKHPEASQEFVNAELQKWINESPGQMVIPIES